VIKKPPLIGSALSSRMILPRDVFYVLPDWEGFQIPGQTTFNLSEV